MPRPAIKTGPSPRVVVAGNGMVCHKLCRSLIERFERIERIEGIEPFEPMERLAARKITGLPQITVVGEEDYPAYDRIHLTDCISRRSPEDLLLASENWYREQGIRLLLGTTVASIDPERRLAVTGTGEELPYEHLVLATGSRPFIPPVPGAELPGVFTYRTMQDLRSLLAYSAGRKRAVVVGGGLLGLEAARAMLEKGMRVEVFENSRYVMSRQLNPQSAEIVNRKLEAMGMEIHLQRNLAAISRSPAPGGGLTLALAEGGTLETDMLILAAGVRPRDELAAGCGLKLGPRGGYAVDDFLRTSLDRIYAIGECAVHAGIGYGLAAPGFRMAECLAGTLLGKPTAFKGADQSTTLKVMGVEVHVIGDHLAEGDESAHSEGDTYRRLTLRKGRLLGAIAVGSWEEAERVREAALKNKRIWSWQLRRFARGAPIWKSGGAAGPSTWPDQTLICHCNQVRKGSVCAAIASGCASVEAVRKATGASAVCGGCQPLLERLLGAPDVPKTRGLVPAALSAALLVALAAASPPIPSAKSMSGHLFALEGIWRNPAWHQATGYAILAFSILVLLLPLRKRLAFFRTGPLPFWKMLHAVVGTAGIVALVGHTGLRLGSGLNLALISAFLSLNLFGTLAAGTLAWMEMRPTPMASGLRTWLTRGHIVLCWPLPILIVFHVWSVYLF